tara:strand:+ start:418 stop:525 length:108 start_codon:yes stop_codon:yes gene_type:complete
LKSLDVRYNDIGGLFSTAKKKLVRAAEKAGVSLHV